jgi:hypothetical protein
MTPGAASHFGLLHEIFILDAELQKPLKHKTRKADTKKLVDEILTALRMEQLGPLSIFDATDKRAPGWSFIQPITTSHVSAHYFEKPGAPNIRMDFYSCASVNWRKLITIVHKHLGLSHWRGTFIDRNTDAQKGERMVIDITGKEDNITKEVTLHLDEPNDAGSRVSHRNFSLPSAS